MLEKLLSPADELYDAVEAGDEEKVYESFVNARDDCHSLTHSDEYYCTKSCLLEGDTSRSDLNTCKAWGAILFSVHGINGMFRMYNYFNSGGVIPPPMYTPIIPPTIPNSVDLTAIAATALGCMTICAGYAFAIKNKAYSAHKKYHTELCAVRESKAQTASSA